MTITTTTCQRSQCRTVRFSEDISILEEPEDLAVDLYLARKSDFAQRQADKARMERLLSPILNTEHRKNIYEKIVANG